MRLRAEIHIKRKNKLVNKKEKPLKRRLSIIYMYVCSNNNRKNAF